MFSRKHLYYLLAMCFTLLSCDTTSSDDNKLFTDKENVLKFSNNSFLLDNGLLLNRGDEGQHYNYDFMITDGTFVPVDVWVGGIPITYWSFGGETVRLELELYSPGRDAFRTGTFAYTPLNIESIKNDPDFQNTFFFLDSEVGLDLDGNGEVETDNKLELFAITGGSITVQGNYPEYRIAFDLELENGLSVNGNYTAVFTVWPVDD